MNKMFFLTVLILIPTNVMYTNQEAHSSKDFQAKQSGFFELPAGLQLELAELKLEKTILKIDKGPQTNYKKLIMPILGMGLGAIGDMCAGASVISGKAVINTDGAGLLISMSVFAYSYWQFNSLGSKETDHLCKKKKTQQDVVDHLKQNLINKNHEA